MRLIFLHIPKSGGTTLRELLIPNFDGDKVCMEYRKIGSQKLSKENASKYNFFTGHMDYSTILDLAGSDSKIITLLRKPQERILSYYYFLKAHDIDFVKNNYPHMLDNLQKALDLTLYAYLCASEDHLKNNMVAQITDNTFDMELAKERLNNMASFGIMEKMDESVRHIFSSLDFKIPETIHKSNSFESFDGRTGLRKVEKEIITAEAQNKLDELCNLDTQLYDYAIDLFNKRIGDS